MTLARLIFVFAFFCVFPWTAQAGEAVAYSDTDGNLEGYYAPSTCGNAGAPVVLVVHQWKGLGDYEKNRADMLAKNCFNAFAIDMYGKNLRPATKEEAAERSRLYKDDPDLARRRLNAALETAKKKAATDTAGIIGYCFGGTMALELARSGADIPAVVSFHGNLASEKPVMEIGAIKGKILVLHGADDPYVPPAEVEGFQREMKQAGAEMTFIAYPGAVHSFTEPGAGNDPSTGVAYNAEADQKSWAEAIAFLSRNLGVTQK